MPITNLSIKMPNRPKKCEDCIEHCWNYAEALEAKIVELNQALFWKDRQITEQDIIDHERGK
jgi:hypothetical protein